MTTITITPFSENSKKAYSRGTPYVAPVDTDGRLNVLLAEIDNRVVQMRRYSGPRGLHLGKWKNLELVKSNLIECHGLAMDWNIRKFEEVRERVEAMDVAHAWVTGETKGRDANTIILIVPFSQPVSAAVYERLACVFAKQIDVYGLVDGSLTATHAVNIHATSLTAFGRGTLLDAEAYKQRTASQYQERDAAKYYLPERPPAKVVEPRKIETEQSHDGMFEWASTADSIVAHAQARINRRG